MTTNKSLIVPKFCCEQCQYITCNKKDYSKHLTTAKHNKCSFDKGLTTEKSPKVYKCNNCTKIYKYRDGLWRHSKKCIKVLDATVNNDNPDLIQLTNLVMKMVEQNQELTKQIVDLAKNSCNNSNNNNNNNTTHINNNKFNLNVFLNETCKDALNINDFVSSIQLQLTDLETTGRVGYVEGISKIILYNLNCLEQYRRPIHCTDMKREIVYIKDNNEWTKEDTEKPILTKAIKIIANENIKKISEWQQANPDCADSDSNKNNVYLNIVSNSMSGSTHDETNKNIGKIISNVTKEVQIDK
jgi:hypothetical protein